MLCVFFVETESVVQEKIFKSCYCSFTNLQLSPLGDGCIPPFEQGYIPHLRRLYGNFGRNWPHGSREEVKIVKSLQTDRQIDRQTNRQTDRQTDS